MAGAQVWLQQVHHAVETVKLRSDYAQTLGAIAATLARCAGAGSTSAPTWVVMAKDAGCTKRTVGRWLAWLRCHDLLVAVDDASTRQTRPHATDLEASQGALYLLTTSAPQPDDALERVEPVSDAPAASVTDVGESPRPLPV